MVREARMADITWHRVIATVESVLYRMKPNEAPWGDCGDNLHHGTSRDLRPRPMDKRVPTDPMLH